MPMTSRTLAAVLGLDRDNADHGAAYDKLFGPEDIAWLKGQTGIQDDAELKSHVLSVQEEAYKVFPYGTIRLFSFTRALIRRIPSYPELLKLGKGRKGALFLDFACCFGNDLRIAVADGFPANQALAADLHPEFWTLGHKLFRSTPETLPARFIPCDVFNSEHIAPADPVYGAPTKPLPTPLSSATSLTEFQGHISAIHTSAFFHLFDEEKQRLAAKALASLLSPLPGSMIFGLHTAVKVPRNRVNDRGETVYLHNAETWAELWDGGVFKQGTVKVEATLIDFFEFMRGDQPVDLPDDIVKEVQERGEFMLWSVTRL